MKYEYGEPLAQSANFSNEIYRLDGSVFAYFAQQDKRHRVIACINACAGVSNEELEKIGLGGVAKIMERETRKEPIAGPPLTAGQAEKWEWTGEQPRRLKDGESGVRSHCVNANCCEPGGILKSFCGEETHSFYWPLRRRQHTESTETPAPQPATLDDIAGLLQRILDRMPERGVE